MAWVVDASAPGIAATDQEADSAAEFVEMINRALSSSASHEEWQREFSSDPAVAAQAALDLARTWWEAKHQGDGPLVQASAAIAYIGEGSVAGFVTGECAMVLRTESEDLAAMDPRFVGGFEDAALSTVAAEITEGTPAGEVYADLAPLRREVFAQRHSDRDQWTLIDHPAACAHGLAVRHPLEDREEVAVLLTSPGLARLDRELASRARVRLMDAACSVGVREALTLVRSIEDRDPECEALPRFGAHRAAVGVLLRRHVH